MKPISFFKKAAFAAALAVAASTANAATIEVGDSLNVRGGAGGELGPSNLYQSVGYKAGAFEGTYTIGLLDLEAEHVGKGDWQRILAFCLEPSVFFGYDNPFKVVDNLSDNLKRMWATHFSSVNTGLEAAAFQVAVWELVTDSAVDLSSGGFQLYAPSSAVGVQAAKYLNSSDWGNTLANLVRLQDNAQNTTAAQDLVIDVPTPSTLALLMLGLLGIGAVRRRAAQN